MGLDVRNADAATPLAVVGSWPGDAAVVAIGSAGVAETAGNLSQAHPWASVTKLLSALAVLVAVEEGTADLDAPAGPPGSTVRHLLSHASGLGPDGTVVTAPGNRRIYSNAGYDLLGESLSQATGMPFALYLQEAVLQPLGMHATTFAGSPASGATGPLADLCSLASALLAGAPGLLSPDTFATATSVAFPGLDGVLPGFGRQRPNDWGLGFELRGAKSPHWTGTGNSPATFGHFGRSGSFLWVDPRAGVACAGASGQPFGPWSALAWPSLSDAVLAGFGPGGAYTLRR